MSAPPGAAGPPPERCRRDTATMTNQNATRPGQCWPGGTTPRIPALRLNGSYLPVLDRARIYCCGITPYDVTHIGHAATFVWVDVLTRALGSIGVTAQLCRNVTDVDDVLFAAAARSGTEYDAFASVQQFRFDQDMSALSVREPQCAPRARRHVGQVIKLAAALLESGAAYQRAGSVYFRGADTAAAAGLSRDDAEALAAEYGARLDDPAKDDKLDVAVWRRSAAGEPGWPSPWGSGRPGWHAECVAMSLSVFGPAVDVLSGGADLSFPHHAYQVAMAEALTGVRPNARAIFEVGVVSFDGAKMAKSTGNLVLVGDVLADHPAAALRLCLLDRPWAQPWDYATAELDAATGRLERLYRAAGRSAGTSQEAASAAIAAALCDDLDVPTALATAEDAGGAVARNLIATLGLSEQGAL
jgi:cysteinyl-tRNA synthetase